MAPALAESFVSAMQLVGALFMLVMPAIASVAPPLDGLLPRQTIEARAVEFLDDFPESGFPDARTLLVEEGTVVVEFTSAVWDHRSLESRTILRQDFFVQRSASWVLGSTLDLMTETGPRSVTCKFEITVPGDEGDASALVLSDETVATFDSSFERSFRSWASSPDPAATVGLLIDKASRDASATMTRTVAGRLGDLQTGPMVNGSWASALQQLGVAAPLGASQGLSSGASSESSRPMKKKPSMWDCWYECFGAVSTPMALADILCITIGGLACLATGPFVGPCVSAVLTGCGVAAVLGEVIAALTCALKC